MRDRSADLRKKSVFAEIGEVLARLAAARGLICIRDREIVGEKVVADGSGNI